MTTSRTISIGELALSVRSADLASAEFDTAIASDFEVEVEFSYKQASAEDDQLAELLLVAIKANSNVHFEGTVTSVIARRGSDLLPLLSHRAVTEMEHRLMAMVEAGE